MTFDRICLGTVEDKFFCEHYLDYGDGHKKFDIGQSADSQYQGKHFAPDTDEVDPLDELSYTPKHMLKSDASGMKVEARCLIPFSGKQRNCFSTGKSHRTSKDRRYIPFPEERIGWNRIRTCGGKGAKHKKSERLLNE